MNKVFADTSGWASFFVHTEPHHEKAASLMRQWKQQDRRVVTTNYVLSELVALFTSPFRVSRSKVLRYIETIRAIPWVEIVHIVTKKLRIDDNIESSERARASKRLA